jgi:hypothetical protein
MSLSILQTPPPVALAQSPMIFSLSENTPVYTSSSFQYVGELYYWTGSLTNSGSSSDYTITKFPNTSNVGIFDLNRIINSTLTDLALYNTSSVTYYAVDFYWQYLNTTTNLFVTGSHLKSSTYKALDGYQTFQQPIDYNLTYGATWPLMTSGPTTQSAFIDNYGLGGVYVGTTGATQPTKIVYTSNVGSADYTVSNTTATTGQIAQYPIGPGQSGFPLSTTNLEYYTVQAYNGASALGIPIRYDIVCTQKYPNVRIKWKNKFGQFDYMNFNMISKESFSTERKTYQPQLGTWEATTLSYRQGDSGNVAYIVDSNQNLIVNSNWLSESYNDILKELLVADEIYWIYDEPNNQLRPLTITTQNIVFKTGVVDHLIQYQFEFQYGQPYKLIM